VTGDKNGGGRNIKSALTYRAELFLYKNLGIHHPKGLFLHFHCSSVRIETQKGFSERSVKWVSFVKCYAIKQMDDTAFTEIT